jgi:hypothetical protein
MPLRRNQLLSHARGRLASATRVLVKIVVMVAVSFLAGYLGWNLIGHNEAAVAVPFLGCMFVGSFWIAWQDVYGFRPGWFWRHSWRWQDQRRSSRMMKSMYDDRADQ